jgi:hypothetical protein
MFLIVLPLSGIAGFVDAVAGGGGLIALPAYLIAGCPVHFAIGTNKVSSGMGTALATYRYARSGYVDWKLTIPCVVAAILGGSLGAKGALLIDEHTFMIIMLIVLPLTAVYIMKGHALSDEKEAYPRGKTMALACLIALVIGSYDGIYGPGTGTFLILLLSGVAHFKLTQANGTAKVINLTTNISAMIVYLLNGKVLIILGLAAGATNLIGSYIGTRYFDKGGAKAVKPVMVIVIVIFFVKVIYELAAG